MKQYIIIKSSK